MCTCTVPHTVRSVKCGIKVMYLRYSVASKSNFQFQLLKITLHYITSKLYFKLSNSRNFQVLVK